MRDRHLFYNLSLINFLALHSSHHTLHSHIQILFGRFSLLAFMIQLAIIQTTSRRILFIPRLLLGLNFIQNELGLLVRPLRLHRQINHRILLRVVFLIQDRYYLNLMIEVGHLFLLDPFKF